MDKDRPSPPKDLSLREAIFLALRYNPNVANAELNRVIQKFNLRVAQYNFEVQYALNGTFNENHTIVSGDSSYTRGSTLTPTATLNGDYGTQYSLTSNNPKDWLDQKYYNPGLDLAITQPLMRGFGKEVTLASLYNAQDTEKQNQYQFEQTIISTVVTVTSNYNSLVQNQNNVIIAKESLDNLQESLQNDEALINAGRRAKADLLQSQSSYASAKVTYQNSLQQLTTAKLVLMNTLGLSESIAFSVPNDLDYTPLRPDFEKCYQIALKNNPVYLSTLLSLNIAERTLLVAKDSARTQLNLSLTGSTGNGSGGPPNDGFRSLTNNKNTELGAGLTLNVPIDDYTLKQQIVNAKIGLQQTQINIETATRQLRIAIYNDVTTVDSNLDAYELAKQAVVLQELNQTKLLARQKLGLISAFEVTQNQTTLNASKQQAVSSKIAYLNSLTQLYQDMGVTLDKWNIIVKY